MYGFTLKLILMCCQTLSYINKYGTILIESKYMFLIDYPARYKVLGF